MPRDTTLALAATALVGIVAIAQAVTLRDTDAIASASAKIPMAPAIAAAEHRANGKAARAEYVQSEGQRVYDIDVVHGEKVVNVKVDPDKGTVLSVTEDNRDPGAGPLTPTQLAVYLEGFDWPQPVAAARRATVL